MKNGFFNTSLLWRFCSCVLALVLVWVVGEKGLYGLELAAQSGILPQTVNQAAGMSLTVDQQSIEKALAQKDVVRKSVRAASFERKLEELRNKAQQQGAVRVIVGFKAGHQPEGELANLEAILEQRDAIAQTQRSFLEHLGGYNQETVKRFETIPFLAMEVDLSMLDRMREFEELASIEEDALMKPSLAESTQIVGATAAWARGSSGTGQTIAILDTGVDKNHSFLAGKVVSEACYSTSSTAQNSNSVCPNGAMESTAIGSGVNCSSSIEDCGHGTHVAGIAAGRGSVFSGVARDSNIIAIQVFSRFNNNSDCSGAAPCVLSYSSDQMKGLERVYALRNSFNIAAVNLSLGGGRYSSNCDAENPGMTAVINNLRSAGIATVISSGNEGFTNAVSSPACISSAISVGSTDDGSGGTNLNAVSDFSNSAGFLNLLAPGKWINSSVPGNRYANYSGTSMAAPHVAGAFAVLKSSAPGASVAQILSALSSTGLNVTDSRNGITKPRIRIDAALDALSGGNCNYSISPQSLSFSANGGVGSVSVSATSGCSWQAVSNANWIAVNSGATGSGNGAVNFSVQSNSATNSRTGSLTIAGRNFTVTQAGSGADPCLVRTPINVGQTLNGSLISGDCQLSDGSFVDFYIFSATSGQQIAVNLDSTAFDTYLLLIGPDGNLIAQNDDSGGGTNSRIPANTGFLTAPTTGTYLIGANSFRAGETGSYSLRLSGQSGCYRGYYVDATNNGTSQWLDTGQDVVSGQAINLTATGLACLIGQRCFGPNGEAGSNPAQLNNGELIGKIGANGASFKIGSNFQQNAPTSGRLFLAVNDSFYPDNSGGFNVCQGGCSGTKLSLPSMNGPNDGQSNVGSIVAVGGINLARVTLNWALNASSAVADSWVIIRDLSTNRLVFNQNLGASQTLTIDLQPNSRYQWGIKAMPKSVASCVSDEVFRTFTTTVATCSSGNFICEQFNNSPSQAVLNGAAVYDSTNREARLTPNQIQQSGSLFFTPTTLIDRFTASFQLRIDGQGADGMSFAVIEGGANSLGRAGGGLGYENITGRSFAIEFDNFYNEEYDPAALPHLGLNLNGNVQSVATVGLPPFQGQGNLTVRVVFDRGTVEVFLPASHAAPAMRATIPNWTPFVGRFGFTAATGGLSQIHVVDSVVVDVQIAQQSCSYALSPTNQSFNASANVGGFSVTTQSGCAWTATSNAPWISITSGANGSGNGTVGYSISANNTGAQRAGTISVGGQTFNITQTACTFALSPPSQNFGAGAATGGFSIVTQAGCAWTAASNQQWIVISSAASGTGNGTVSYNVAANNTATQRTGAINVAGQNFTVTQEGTTATGRALRVVASSGAPGGSVVVPVELSALGNENALGFSLIFDHSILSNPQATLGVAVNGATLNSNNSQAGQGRFGVLLALPSGQSFNAGTHQILNISFSVAAGASASSTSIGFGDQPIVREISDTGANLLPAIYLGGAINITQGYESDVAPRPNGNGSLGATDWVQVGRFVAGLDVPAVGGEFQRTDVAPRSSLGDGRLTVTDWVQAGRYVAGLDPLTAAGGPDRAASAISMEADVLARNSTASNSFQRELRLVPREFENASVIRLSLELSAQGDENASAFSFGFDVAQLRFLSAELGTDSGTASLHLNTKQVSNGYLGVVLALPAGRVLAAGKRHLLTLSFVVANDAEAEFAAVRFLNNPVTREMADSRANPLPASYIDCIVPLADSSTRRQKSLRGTRQ